MGRVEEFENMVHLTGTIMEEPIFSHEAYEDKIFYATVKVRRNEKVYDVIPLNLSRKFIDENSINVGSYVDLSGQFRSYNKRAGVHNQLVLYVFVQNISVLEKANETDTNSVALHGIICKQPKLKEFTRDGKQNFIDNMLLSVPRAHGKSDYIPCVAWDDLAKMVDRDVSVSSAVIVKGRVQSRKYIRKLENNTTENKISYEMVASSIEVQSK